MVWRRGLAVAALLAALIMVAASRVTPLRIMPVGDSITEGDMCVGGYRTPLGRLLLDSGVDFDFVGTQNSGPTDLDNDHEGYSGWTIGEMTAHIGPVIDSLRPDVALLLIGTNDMWSMVETATHVASLDSLIRLMRSRSPRTRVVVGSIPPMEFEERIGSVDEYNRGVRELIERGADPMVNYADVCGEVAIDDLGDGIHPDSVGHFRIAQGWFGALARVYGWTTGNRVARTRHIRSGPVGGRLFDLAGRAVWKSRPRHPSFVAGSQEE